jgi:hypothetical protein
MPRMPISPLSRSLLAVPVAAAIVLAGCAGYRSADDFARLEAKLRADGKLRTETAPADAPYDAEDLVANFARIALHHEASVQHRGGEDNWRPNPVKRWQGPLNYALRGDAVTPQDRAEVARLMARVAAATGLEISEVGQGWNFLILITTAEERGRYSAELARLSPGVAATFDLWRQSPQVICIANDPFSNEDGRRLSDGMVAIGAEVGGLLRRACLHEEIVQSLGLANDHPEARPSIFNDDGEFALLTAHDEDLLRILYDPGLAPGMSADEAMPVVRRIARQMRPGAAAQ